MANGSRRGDGNWVGLREVKDLEVEVDGREIRNMTRNGSWAGAKSSAVDFGIRVRG